VAVGENMIGAYGNWASQLVGEGPTRLSFLQSEFEDVEAWRDIARGRLKTCLAQPEMQATDLKVDHQYVYDGLHIEELSWQLDTGPRTEAIFLKPEGATGLLPGVLGLHCHGGKKYFGKRKITRTAEERHPTIVEHQYHYYEGVAWANELAKRGYGVLVHDTFPFASRRVRVEEVSELIRQGLTDADPESRDNILAYNKWAAQHEDIVAKSLFCGGTTWPGVYLTEDQRALDVLCERDDIDADRVGCGGLSGGGMRTVFLGGSDDRIKCAVCVGMMSTWRDYLLNKCHTHTWMVYVPLLARDLDYCEILGLRVPLSTMVLNNREDQLFTLPEMERADGILRDVYEKAGANDQYQCNFYSGPHKFDLEMQADAFEWFDRWV
jgi:dienelactone hydrolase